MSAKLGRPFGTVSKRVLRLMQKGLTKREAQRANQALLKKEWHRKHSDYWKRQVLLRMGEQKRCFLPARRVQHER